MTALNEGNDWQVLGKKQMIPSNTSECCHDEMQMRYTSPRFLNRLARAAGVRGEPLP